MLREAEVEVECVHWETQKGGGGGGGGGGGVGELGGRSETRWPGKVIWEFRWGYGSWVL